MRYKQSLRSNNLKQSLRPLDLKKLKRQFYRKIPTLFLSLLLILTLVLLGSFFLNKFFLNRTFFVSPLARVDSLENTSIEDLLNKNNIQFIKVDRNIVYLKDQGEVFLNLDKNLALQISSLQLILSRLTIEGKKFKKLDLRFEKPIIEF